MYRILIADDEGIVRESLKFIITKDFGDSCELYYAKSGRQAIEIAEENTPDIAFIDIQMPGINGLDALREIRRLNPRLHALILSAYDNFDYAKEAIRLGADDYLMKPIDRQKVIECLTKIMKLVDTDRQKRKDSLDIKEKMEAVIPILENGFVLSLITRNDYEYSGVQYRGLLEITDDFGFIIVMEWDEGFTEKTPENPVGASVRANKFATSMRVNIKSYFASYVSSVMGNKVFCAVPSASGELTYSERIRIIEKVRALVKMMEDITGIKFKAGIGGIQRWETMFDSYMEAVNALHNGVRAVTHIDDLVVQSTQTKQQAENRKALIDSLSSGHEQQVRIEINTFWGSMMKAADITFEDIKVELLELFIEGRKSIPEQNRNDSKGYEYLILRAGSIDELKGIFTEGMALLCKEASPKDHGMDDTIVKARDYILKNYCSELSLEKVAEEVNISPYYFSKLFKQEMGTGFSDYITGLRIEKAKQLLQSSDMSMKEVCAQVGYSNQNYFSRIFKSKTGNTPTELREILQGSSGGEE